MNPSDLLAIQRLLSDFTRHADESWRFTRRMVARQVALHGQPCGCEP